MATKDKRVDAYIRGRAEFARPILAHLRAIVHESCPEAVETLKWGAPAFEYKGLLCGMAGFKQHCALWFWQHRLVLGPGATKAREGRGSFGRIRSLSDLPPKSELRRLVKRAMQIKDEGVKAPRKESGPRKALPMPTELAAALRKNERAAATFAAFSPSRKRDYVEWIAEAKRDETRARRLATAIEWMAAGKSRNWRYERR